MNLKIAISGKIASGKTTTSKYLQSRISEAKIFSFAGRLKELATELFGYDENNKDRKLLQDFGSSVRNIDLNAWINSLNVRTKDCPVIIIDDLRMPNEYNYLRDNGYFIIRLEISPEVQENRIRMLYSNYQEHLERITHSTETSLDNYKFDYVIDADDDENINNRIDEILEEISVLV